MMSRLGIGDPGLPPESVCGYIEDMLMELAILAGTIGEGGLCSAIEASALMAGRANLVRRAAISAAANDAA
jgi:hypothetical protein